MGHLCDFCGEQRSMVYCRSDEAVLCLSCDRNVHFTNALSRRHSRTLLCGRCNSQPSFVRCIEENISLCQNCDWLGHTGSTSASTHKRQTFNCYSGCPSAEEFSTIWSFDLVLSAMWSFDFIASLLGEDEGITQSLPNETPVVVDQKGIPQLTLDTSPSDQGLMTTVDTNGVAEETSLQQLLLTVRQENPDEDFVNGEVEQVGIGGEGTKEGEIVEAQSNSWHFVKRKRKEKTPRRERGKKKTTRVRYEISYEEILQVLQMQLKDAARHLKVSVHALKHACQEYGINIWRPRTGHKDITQSLPSEKPTVVDQEGIPKLTSDTVPFDQALMAAVDTNNVALKEIPPQFLPTARQENPNENSCNDEVEAVGMGGVGTREGEMKEGELNSGSSNKGKRNEKTIRGERANSKHTGVRIEIALEEILCCREMCRKDAAKQLQVSESTLKRVCREYNIHRWPPREVHKVISQSCPNKSPLVVDQEQIRQLNFDMVVRSNQASIETSSVIVKAKYETFTIKFRLSRPWRKVELEECVKMRLQLEVGTYHTEYKDEDGELILISCDQDLKEYIPNSSPTGTCLIELFLRRSSS